MVRIQRLYFPAVDVIVTFALRVLVVLSIVLIAACSQLPSSIELKQLGQAALKGYRTQCQGAAQVEKNGESFSTVFLEEGQTEVLLRYVSETFEADPASGESGYLCTVRSRHKLRFTAVAGKTYLIKGDESKGLPATISIREQLGRGPDSQKIEAQVSTLGSSKRCKYYAPYLDCPR